MTKCVLIAGGAGFLGSHLCDHYISQGYRVVVVDNLSTGSRNNIEHLCDNSNFVYVKTDIVDSLPEQISKERFDYVLNLASPASPPQYQRLSIETMRVGSEGTLRLLEVARRNNARFFQASTSEVYGDPEVHPQPESYRGSVNCYGPRAMYDESKRYAEALIYAYQSRYPEVSTCIARFFNTYGPRMDDNDGRVVSNFIVQALSDKPITIYGDGSQTRSFCYVSDLVSGVVKLVDSKEHEPINLGNPGEFTVKQLAEKVLALTGSKSRLTFMPLPKDDPTQRKPVIQKAKKLLDWQPKISLNDGLVKTISYFKTGLGTDEA